MRGPLNHSILTFVIPQPQLSWRLRFLQHGLVKVDLNPWRRLETFREHQSIQNFWDGIELLGPLLEM